MMTFNEYTVARRSAKLGISVDNEAINRFVSAQPTACPACGAQVFDPFGMRVVIHDVARCAGIGTNSLVVWHRIIDKPADIAAVLCQLEYRPTRTLATP